MIDELARLDAVDHAGLVASGTAHPRELVAAAIERIEVLNPRLNAVIITQFDKARQIAERSPTGPFAGVPMLLKDSLCHMAGDPYYHGMRLLKELDWRASHDTTLALRFRAAGFVNCGRTNTPELAASATTEPDAFGPTINPWDTSHSPGGSSGGSAVAVASGMVPVAHGTDMAGSIRIPASHCGLVGLKPTRGRISLGPEFADLWCGMATQSVLTRTVRDSAAVLEAVHGGGADDLYVAPVFDRSFAYGSSALTPLRIGVRTALPGALGDPDPACHAEVVRVADALADLGHAVEETGPVALDGHPAIDRIIVLLWISLAREVDRWAAQTQQEIGSDDLEAATWAQAELGRRLGAAELLGINESMHSFSREVASWWSSGFDALLTPTTPDPPQPLGQKYSGPFSPTLPRPIAFTAPFNVTGQPAISLPAGLSPRGLPIGVQLVGALGRDDVLLHLSSQLERVLPWADRNPGGLATDTNDESPSRDNP